MHDTSTKNKKNVSDTKIHLFGIPLLSLLKRISADKYLKKENFSSVYRESTSKFNQQINSAVPPRPAKH